MVAIGGNVAHVKEHGKVHSRLCVELHQQVLPPHQRIGSSAICIWIFITSELQSLAEQILLHCAMQLSATPS